MVPPKHPMRAQQWHKPGLGLAFSSPVKHVDKKKTSTYVLPLGHDLKWHCLEVKMDALLNRTVPPPPGEGSGSTLSHSDGPANVALAVPPKDSDHGKLQHLPGPNLDHYPSSREGRKSHRIVPDKKAYMLYQKWGEVILTLIDPYLSYLASSTGAITQPLISLQSQCLQSCTRKISTILCLFQGYFHKFDIGSCACQETIHVLLVNGLFPTAPTYPHMAVSIHLLNFYHALFEKSCNTGLGYAIQWYDILQVHIEQRVESSLEYTDTKRCPACFSGVVYERKFEQGGNIHVVVDRNFNHQHLRSAGQCPVFYNPQYMLSKEQVDAVGECIKNLRKKPPKLWWPVIPDEAVDECESSHMAGSGSNSKTNMEKFDDGGQMALVCQHNIPLFLANIDMPGEQQKYAIALIEHLFSLLPSCVMVASLYDVGCVLDHSLQLYDILPTSIMEHLLLATSAMHAYAHQWACQLIYNPCLHNGLGLSDGEGKLIGITRSSAQWRWIWLIDRQVASINCELRNDLGDWIKRRLTKGIESQMQEAQVVLDDCGVPIADLHSLKEKVEALYTSLNVLNSFPELQGLDLEFRAIRSFFEWDKPDQVAGSHEEALGMKLHQSTRKAISKHKPALMNAIQKYNKYCETLEALYKPEWDIPLPGPLLTQLAPLRDGSNLMEDVWIMHAEGKIPHWLEDADVREGIRSLLKLDQCLEERRHLGMESDNLCRWFG
ncbi:hypothetical protein L208DRAFT_1425851 [Tricholoma matsutake]|nr:hypothetical protein L208DRAFT_1425851 [Tricholoma matsutake 945]